MTTSQFRRPHSSFESLRKQAKKLARDFASQDPHAIARVQAQLPDPSLPLTLRDAQLVLAREYGFAGWQDLRESALRQEGKGLEWAAAESERAIHDHNPGRLRQLVEEYPELLSWRKDSGESLLQFAAGSFGDSGEPSREERFTSLECAAFLLDAGAAVEPAIWQNALDARSHGVLQLLNRKGALPRRLDLLAALGDTDAVRASLESTPAPAAVSQALLCACRFQQRETAALLLDRAIELDPALGTRVEKWRGSSGFIEYLGQHPQEYGTPWRTVVMNELLAAIDRNDLEAFAHWMQEDLELTGEARTALQVKLVENAVLKDRGPFIVRLMELDPALAKTTSRLPSSAIVMALDYGRAHLIPLLTRIWPLPDDLCHAAGTGDFARVRAWFDKTGRPRLGSLDRHYPTNQPAILRNLHWLPANAQQILDVALAWACLNGHFEIASFLLERGANINTDWSTHEPASILHECAIRGDYRAARFLIDHGIDMTIRDYRWNGTAEGWARYAYAVNTTGGIDEVKDESMAEFLARAERDRDHRP